MSDERADAIPEAAMEAVPDAAVEAAYNVQDNISRLAVRRILAAALPHLLPAESQQ